MLQVNSWQWALLAVGAFVVGLSKTGIAGLGVLTVALFANALPARASTGALLPLMICADVFGVGFYRKHANWSHLWRLFPWVVVGVVAGYLAMDRISNEQVRRLIGGILLAMVALHLWRHRQVTAGADQLAVRVPHARWFTALMGILAGFTTMVANAAGPVMILYLLAAGMPKLEFIGTGAWFFLIVNVFKVPFSFQLGLINVDSLVLDAALLVPMVPGALLGPVIVRHLPQRAFEQVALALTGIAALRLMW